MKNKFMTKALAVVLSASMALSLSSATALTANAAAAPKLAKKTVSVKAGKKAKNKLKAASYKAGWRITKATVKKTAVAKAKVKKNKKVVVVTGVKKGATKIVLKLKNAKTGAAKKLKFKAKVKVDKPVIEEPVVETASITAAKQTAFDTVILTFDKEIDATAVSLETVAINGGLGAATSVTIGDDKKTATVVYGYAENTEYTFTVANLGGSQSIKTGSYAVSDIKIADQAVEAGSDQPVVYALVAGEVDVTKYNNYTDYVVFDFGEGCDSYSADPNKPTVYFADKDKSCEVKVTYNNGTDAEIVKTVKITSTAATATAAEARFAADDLLKWYLCDDTTTSFGITPEDTTDKTVVFYAKNKDGKAVKYDDIEVTTSNENVAGVSWSQQANGKYYTIAVQPGGSAGTAKMTIKTTEYKGTEEVKNEFTFDVVSKEKNNNLYAVNVDTTSVALYNSPYAPEKKIEFKAVNSLGEEVTVDSYDIEVFKGKDDATGLIDAYMDGKKLVINALTTPAGTYKIDVTVSGESGNNTKEIKKSINVRVTDALAEVVSGNYVETNEGLVRLGVGETEALGQLKDKFSATYKVEVADLKITDMSGCDTSKQVKLAVYVNGKPIGYLTTSGVAGFVASLGDGIGRRALSATLSTGNTTFPEGMVDFEEVHAYIYAGTKYYWSESGNNLYLGQDGKKEYSTKTNFESTDSLHDAALNVGGTYHIGTKAGGYTWYGDGSAKNNVAAAGAYNVVVKYGWFNDKDNNGNAQMSKQLGNTGKFNVSYSLTMPKVEINTSETAEHQLIADVDLVAAEDGTSVSASTADKKVGYSFGGADPKFSKGDKIFAIRVVDNRGRSDKKDVDGGVIINFIIEKTVKFTA